MIRVNFMLTWTAPPPTVPASPRRDRHGSLWQIGHASRPSIFAENGFSWLCPDTLRTMSRHSGAFVAVFQWVRCWDSADIHWTLTIDCPDTLLTDSWLTPDWLPIDSRFSGATSVTYQSVAECYFDLTLNLTPPYSHHQILTPYVSQRIPPWNIFFRKFQNSPLQMFRIFKPYSTISFPLKWLKGGILFATDMIMQIDKTMYILQCKPKECSSPPLCADWVKIANQDCINLIWWYAKLWLRFAQLERLIYSLQMEIPLWTVEIYP